LSLARPQVKPEPRRTPVLSLPYRLDLLPNPYGPSLRVPEAIASVDDLHLPHPDRVSRLRRCIAELHGVGEPSIVLGNGIDELLLAAIRLGSRPVLVFPPTDESTIRLAGLAGAEIVARERGERFEIELDAADRVLPANCMAIVQSPNDPTGTILTGQDVVRLARRMKLVIIDERHAAYSPRTLVPFTREFDNVVVLRSFEFWAGLTGLPIAYGIAPQRLAAALNECRFHRDVAIGPVIAAQATMEDLPWVGATVERVRDEKSRLYRTLRKLNMIRPLPSWANFLLAHVERGDPDHFQAELHRRGIHIHRPSHTSIDDCFRISATTGDATNALKCALIEAAREID
jgi:histidinol-phosphate aminotransferase